MIKKTLLPCVAVAVMAICLPAAAQAPVKAAAGVYKLEPTHAFLTWSLIHTGVSHYLAKFTKYDVTINLNPANLAASSVQATIDPMSVVTDYAVTGDYKKAHPERPFAGWDDEVRKADRFLNGLKFPQITFKSTKVELTGPRTAKVTGDLTFLGVTKPVTMDATFNGEIVNDKATIIGFGAKTQISRADFGMARSGGIGDAVTIAFDGEFHRQP